MKSDSEDQLQISVIDYLRLSLPKSAIVFHCPNGGQRNAREGAKFKRMGVLAGIPDVCILYNGQAYFIELKTQRGILSPTQKELHQRFRESGFWIEICRNLSDVEHTLELWDIPQKAMVAA